MKSSRASHLSTLIYNSVRGELSNGLAARRANVNLLFAAVTLAFEDHLLAKRIFPFKTKQLAEAGKHQAFECLAYPQRAGFLRQVRKTVKRKGKRSLTIHYVDSRGTIIPRDLAHEMDVRAGQV